MTPDGIKLAAILEEISELAVAVSGGVDSMTLAAFAHRVLGARAAMYHAVSPAVPAEATQRVRDLAKARGCRLETFDAGEFADGRYRANPANRCFFCKINLYGTIRSRTRHQIVSGTNMDDLGEFRPGLEAARAHEVRHPYVEAGMDKPAVRRLSTWLGLGDIAALPAAPCLSSRVETGVRIEPAMLGAIHAAEKLVTATLAPRTVRCRMRAAGVVVELDARSLGRLTGETDAALRASLAQLLMAEGVEAPISFAPYRSGSAFLQATP
jgi:pyridinium-3,5-biscarboxylic acid mononucleotide sulfurtransferase